MKRRLILFLCVILLAVTFSAAAQAPRLSIVAAPVKVDGVFGEKEYNLVTDAAGMKLGLTWTADTLFVGLSAPTAGWVAAGLGSAKMDGAVMYIGYVTGAATELKVQKGAGHRHADTEVDSPTQYAMKEAGDQTVLEFAVKSKAVIARSQRTLDVVLAMGSADSFTSMHKARASLEIGLAE